MRVRSDVLQSLADRILAMRGVKQGGIEIIAGLPSERAQAHGLSGAHTHAHSHAHAHSHSDGALSEAETAASTASGPARAARRGTPAKTGTRGLRPSPPRRGRSRPA